jgi:hypothetical protein
MNTDKHRYWMPAYVCVISFVIATLLFILPSFRSSGGVVYMDGPLKYFFWSFRFWQRYADGGYLGALTIVTSAATLNLVLWLGWNGKKLLSK